MFFFLFDVAILGGATYAGVKVYQQQRQRQRPLVQLLTASDSAAIQPRAPLPGRVVNGRGQQVPPDELLGRLLDRIYAASEAFARTHIAPYLGLVRADGLATRSEADADEAIPPEERHINRALVLSTSSMVLMSWTPLLPFLRIVSVPGLIILTVYFLRDGYKELVHERKVEMNVMNAVLAVALMATGNFMGYSFISFLYAGAEKIILRSRAGMVQSVIDVFGELPQTTWVLRDGAEVELLLNQVEVGDMLVINSGGMIPVDGTIDHGMATIDQRMLTGEAQPAEKGEGDHVFAATVVMAGRIYVRVEKTGFETLTAQIGKILENTADYRSSAMLRGAQLASQTALPVMLLSAATLPVMGFSKAVAVLLAHFGYDVRFTAPIAVLNYLQVAARHHILVKDGRALEGLCQVDTVVFDKTGTLTQEQPHVKTIHPVGGFDDTDVLRYAAAAEYRQPHPFAHAILHAAAERGIDIPEIDEASYEVGFGVRVRFHTQLLRVGSARFMEREGVAFPADIQALQSYCYEQGHSLVYVALDQRLCGTIELRPTVRPEAAQVVEGLRQRGMKLYVISGDHEKPTRQLARELGIEHYFAEVLPQHKSALIEQLQQEGHTVCFVGDGINDSIALKQANVSISLRGASTIATDTAQVVLMDGSLGQLNHLFDMAKDLDKNLNIALASGIIPCVITLASVYILQLGVVTAAVINMLGLAYAITNGMLPLWRYQAPEGPGLLEVGAQPASPASLAPTSRSALPAE